MSYSKEINEIKNEDIKPINCCYALRGSTTEMVSWFRNPYLDIFMGTLEFDERVIGSHRLLKLPDVDGDL